MRSLCIAIIILVALATVGSTACEPPPVCSPNQILQGGRCELREPDSSNWHMLLRCSFGDGKPIRDHRFWFSLRVDDPDPDEDRGRQFIPSTRPKEKDLAKYPEGCECTAGPGCTWTCRGTIGNGTGEVRCPWQRTCDRKQVQTTVWAGSYPEKMDDFYNWQEVLASTETEKNPIFCSLIQHDGV